MNGVLLIQESVPDYEAARDLVERLVETAAVRVGPHPSLYAVLHRCRCPRCIPVKRQVAARLRSAGWLLKEIGMFLQIDHSSVSNLLRKKDR